MDTLDLSRWQPNFFKSEYLRTWMIPVPQKIGDVVMSGSVFDSASSWPNWKGKLMTYWNWEPINGGNVYIIRYLLSYCSVVPFEYQ